LLNDLDNRWSAALRDLSDNAGLVAQYFNTGHKINVWTAEDMS
jgi:hypothetical protein